MYQFSEVTRRRRRFPSPPHLHYPLPFPASTVGLPPLYHRLSVSCRSVRREHLRWPL